MAVSKQVLAAAVASRTSYRGVLHALGLSVSGASYAQLKRKIAEYDINTSHLVGHTGVGPTRDWSGILRLRSPSEGRVNSKRLKQAMLDAGFEYHCNGEGCGLTIEWMGTLLILEVDHVNGLWWDDRPVNLRFLCPNCHSQQTTSTRPRKAGHCLGCRGVVSRNATRCRGCANKIEAKRRRESGDFTKVSWPSSERLAQMVEVTSWSAVGRELGVSDNAVRKRLRKFPPKY